MKYWATINEPKLFAELSYTNGLYPPHHCSPPFGNCSSGNSDIEPILIVHNSILAHAKAVKIYRDHFQASFLSYLHFTTLLKKILFSKFNFKSSS